MLADRTYHCANRWRNDCKLTFLTSHYQQVDFHSLQAGWGKSDDADVRQNLLKQVDLKAVSNEHCFLRNYILAQISSNRTFCAGSERSGPCLGDSGGGFYVKSGKHWIMQGIISAAIMNDNDCDTDTFSIYTNVNLFTLWIKSVIEGTGPTGIYLIALNKSYDYERFDGEFKYEF